MTPRQNFDAMSGIDSTVFLVLSIARHAKFDVSVKKNLPVSKTPVKSYTLSVDAESMCNSTDPASLHNSQGAAPRRVAWLGPRTQSCEAAALERLRLREAAPPPAAAVRLCLAEPDSPLRTTRRERLG